MYTIVMNDNKELITTRYATLYQKEKLANQIQFIYPQTCGLVNLSECIAVLKYIDIGNEAHSEILAKDSEPYKETKVRAVLPVDTKLNRFAGNVSVRLVFMKMNPESMQLEQKMMSSNVIITIEPVDVITESTDTIEKIAALETKIAMIENNQVDDLILTGDLLQLSKDDEPVGDGVNINTVIEEEIKDGVPVVEFGTGEENNKIDNVVEFGYLEDEINNVVQF